MNRKSHEHRSRHIGRPAVTWAAVIWPTVCWTLVGMFMATTRVAHGQLATGSGGMVATVHPLATQAAVDVMRDGGNAVDAAVAAALTLGVVDGYNSGIGGGCFILIRRADGKLFAIDGREMAPAKATRDMYVRDGQADPSLSQVGALASGVPGALAAYDKVIREHGRLPLARLLKPGEKLADEGFEINEPYANRIAQHRAALAQFPATKVVLLREDGSAPPAGTTLVQHDLAKTYRAIAEHGSDWFYKGPFAESVETWMEINGGIMTAEDLANYQVKSREPLVSKYREYTIVGFPPPSSGGVHVAQMLNILEPFDVAAIADKDWAAYLHLMAETMKLAFADRAHWLGDPDFAQVPRGLVEPQYGRELAKRIQMDRTTPVRSHGQPPRAETELFERHTTHIAAADAAGNWVGITATINTTFGSKVIIPGTGVVMNNEMDDFSIQPGVPNAFGLIGAEANAVAPGKRPLSSMSPTIVLRGDQPILTVGAAGGPKIITQVLQTIVRRLDLDMSLYNAVASPRIHHQWSPDRLYVERELADPFVDGLTVRGHAVVRTGGAGVTQAIEYDPDRRQFLGLHDPRVPGQAMGFQARVEAAPPSLDPTELVARESLTLKGGKTYQGLLLRRSPGELEFVQVGLPKGKPMFLVRISFDPTSVERYEPLERARRNELFARIRPLLASKRHAVIEAGRMADVRLDPIELDGRTMLRCDSPLFQLVSSADESSTRRCFVRLEQVFRAFQRVLPPRVSPDRPLVIRLHGSADEYHEQLRSEGWDIRNPAFYSASRNMIVAGCDLTFFADRLRRTHEQNEQVREQYTRLNAGLTDRLADLTAELKEAGFSNDEIQREVNARRALWKNELETALKQIDAVDRRNDARFAEVSGEMFARLKHEAFHAYTRNFVFTQPRAELPVWLNEGLAQVFETAPIDGDRLRIDAPDPERLRRLQQELAGSNTMSVADLLNTDGPSFLATHTTSDFASDRNYLYAWGVAYYLTFYRDLLKADRLAEFAAAANAPADSPDAFERLVGQSIESFDRQWRDAIRSLRPISSADQQSQAAVTPPLSVLK